MTIRAFAALLALAGNVLAAERAPRTVELSPGDRILIDLGADDTEVQIHWLGGQSRHVLLIEQIRADVILSRHNGLVAQNAPSGRMGPELALLDTGEVIRVARKLVEPIAWQLDLSSYPIGRREQAALEAIESAHRANSSGMAAKQEQALKSLSEALALKATLPPQLSLECPIRFGIAALSRRLKRRQEAILAYQQADAVCTDPGWHPPIQNGLGLAYRDDQQFEQARQHFERARTSGMATGSTYEAASAANNLCLVRVHDGALTEAKSCFQSAIKEYRRFGLVTHVADPLLNLGAAALALGEPDLAQQSIKEAIAIREQANDSAGLTKALMNLARAQAGGGELQAALISINEAQWRADSLGDHDQRANIILIKADLNHQLGDEKALRGDVQAMLSLSASARNPRTEALAWQLKAMTMPPKEALFWQQKAEQVWRTTKQPAPLADTLLAISRTAQALGRPKLARQAATEALDLASTHNVQATKADALQELGYLQRQDQPEAALKHLRAAAALNHTLGRVTEQTENAYQIALLLKDTGQSEAATLALTEAAELSVRALAQPLSQRLRRLQSTKAADILSTWADWLLAGQDDTNIPADQALAPLLLHWNRVNQWRNRTDRLDHKATTHLSEWRAKLLALRNPDQTDETRARLQQQISWLEQQMDLVGNANAPSIAAITNVPQPNRHSEPVANAARVWLLPGKDHVYALIHAKNARQLLRLPSVATILSWQARIRENPNKPSLWSELDERMDRLRQVLEPARELVVFDPEMLGIPWFGLLADARGQMLVDGRTIRYLQAWNTDAPSLALHPLRVGWPVTGNGQIDSEQQALMQAMPSLLIQDDMSAGNQAGAWILQVPGHHVIDQNGLAQAISLAPSGGGKHLFGPERLDEFAVPPRMVFLNVCRGQSGTGGLGLVDLIARPGVQAAIINAWDVPDAAAARFAVHFYKQLTVTPDNPADALARTQTAFAKRGGRRLLREWAGYVLVELANAETPGTNLRE